MLAAWLILAGIYAMLLVLDLLDYGEILVGLAVLVVLGLVVGVVM